MRTAAFVAILVLLAWPGYAFTPEDPTHGIITLDLRVPDVPNDPVTALRDRYAAAVNAADPAALGQLYTPDSLVVVADGVVLRGAAEIARYYQDAFAARPEGAAVTLRPERFSVENGVASETGTFSETGGAGDTAAPATGVYVTIYTQTPSGEWRIAMEVRTRGRDKQLVRW
jgi:uncharacterized protein (TIGR02246 family)